LTITALYKSTYLLTLLTPLQHNRLLQLINSVELLAILDLLIVTSNDGRWCAMYLRRDTTPIHGTGM